jgi:hypothetical protein
MRKLLFNYSFYSHPEIGNFRVWQQRCYVRDSNKEKRSKKLRSKPGRTSFLDSEDLKVMSGDQERIHNRWLLHNDYSRTLTARVNFLLLLFPLG